VKGKEHISERGNTKMAKGKEPGALKMLSSALELEERGEKFYIEAIRKCKNEMGKEIFAMLRKDEVVHRQRIRNIYESLNAGHGWTEEWKKLEVEHGDMKSLFARLAKKSGKNIRAQASDLDALEVGVDLEQRSIKFYKEHLEKSSEALEKNFLNRMIKEEYSHFEALNDMLDYLTDPESWFMKKERILPSGP
jgi:rubrerythrin